VKFAKAKLNATANPGSDRMPWHGRSQVLVDVTTSHHCYDNYAAFQSISMHVQGSGACASFISWSGTSVRHWLLPAAVRHK